MTATTTADSYGNIPSELRTPKLWLQWYPERNPKKPGKKPRKHPCVKYATPADREANLRSLDYLLENRPKQKGGGVQRYVEPSEPFTYIDIDHVRNHETGDVEEWAEALIAKLDTYTEISFSGTGFHLVARGKLEEDFNVEGHKVEIYGSGKIPNKLIAMTGELYELYCTIQDRQVELEQLLEKVKAETNRGNGKEIAEQVEEGIVFGCMDDVTELPIEWLWPNRIPLSALTIFTGNPDTGKTLGYCDLAARISTEKDFP
ncbi:MAG: AAA family ATPase, partial [Candidatus Korobacteraceae bacterium]